MSIDQKEQLSRKGDMGVEACAIRLIAARHASGAVNQKAFAEACGVSYTSYNNMEKGRQFPNREVMRYLFRGHRIDFNFMMNGDFSQLPHDVLDLVFAQLPAASIAWDQKSNSD
jgi:DNA-binding XRE family transcriptional regulator